MLSQYYRFNKVAGLSVHVKQDGTFVLNGCILNKDGKTLAIDKKIEGIKSVEELQKVLPSGTIIALNLSGKGILTRKINHTVPVDAGNFSSVMPNAKPEDFSWQQVVGQQYSFVSVIRNSEVEKWFQLFQKAGYVPVSLSLGPFVIQQIEDDLNIYGEDLTFAGHKIQRSASGDWLQYQYDAEAGADFKIKIQQESLNQELLLPYAAALQVLLSGLIEPIAVKPGLFDDLLVDRQAKQKIKVNAAIVLCITFVLLLINFVVFSWLGTTNQQLVGRLGQIQQHANTTKVSGAQIKDQESILNGLGWDNTLSKSHVADQLASLLPADISWTAITINPPRIDENQHGKGLAFANRVVTISGRSDKVLSVNEWIARIKVKTWVKGARLENYTFNQEQNTGLFTIVITY